MFWWTKTNLQSYVAFTQDRVGLDLTYKSGKMEVHRISQKRCMNYDEELTCILLILGLFRLLYQQILNIGPQKMIKGFQY